VRLSLWLTLPKDFDIKIFFSLCVTDSILAFHSRRIAELLKMGTKFIWTPTLSSLFTLTASEIAKLHVSDIIWNALLSHMQYLCDDAAETEARCCCSNTVRCFLVQCVSSWLHPLHTLRRWWIRLADLCRGQSVYPKFEDIFVGLSRGMICWSVITANH